MKDSNIIGAAVTTIESESGTNLTLSEMKRTYQENIRAQQEMERTHQENLKKMQIEFDLLKKQIENNKIAYEEKTAQSELDKEQLIAQNLTNTLLEDQIHNFDIKTFVKGKFKHNINLQEVLNQLDNINDITYIKSRDNNKDYIDKVISKYRKAKIDPAGGEENLLSLFYNKLQQVFKNPDNHLKLRELGATDTDFALIENNYTQMVILCKSIPPEKNIYELGKQFRFLDVAHQIFGKEFTGDKIRLNIKSMDKSFTLGKLPWKIFSTVNNDKEIKTLALIIEDSGHEAWDSNNAETNLNNFQSIFDKIITYGNGNDCIDYNTIPKILSKSIKYTKNLELDFALIQIHIHGYPHSPVYQDIIYALPPLAKKNIYIFDSCFGGQYHQFFTARSNDIFITNASDSEPCSPLEIDYIKFNKCFADKTKIIANLIEYYSKFTLTTPHISGKINGQMLVNIPIKDLISDNLVVLEDNYPPEEPIPPTFWQQFVDFTQKLVCIKSTELEWNHEVSKGDKATELENDNLSSHLLIGQSTIEMDSIEIA